jgi:capsular exopolysaccharide synthesis family protein
MRNEATQSRRVLMVTSPRSGEGKTTLSVHLATSIARSHRKTLLVDGDLHHPLLHRLFDLGVEPGLSAVLRGETELEQAIQASPVEGLFILPAGRRTSDSTHLLADRRMQELLNRLREEFEYIVFDCSPVLPVVDALLIGAHTDGVLLSVRPQLSQVPELQDACERLHSARIPILGAVMNGVRVSTYAFDYPYPAPAET